VGLVEVPLTRHALELKDPSWLEAQRRTDDQILDDGADHDPPGLGCVYERFGFSFHSERDMGSIIVVRYQLATSAAS
jgi:hypothetical protein